MSSGHMHILPGGKHQWPGAIAQSSLASRTRARYASAAAATAASRSDTNWLVFLAAHVPLAIALRTWHPLATLHGMLVLMAGVAFAVVGRRRDDRLLALCGYVVGAEVLWRMCSAHLFWEFGKYTVALVLAVACLRRGWVHRSVRPALLYLALLLPSTAFWLNQDPVLARQMISFNLSGPLCLAVSAIYLGGVRLDWPRARTMLLAMLAPILGVAAIATHGTFTATNLTFTDESNFATSGGFGPNQVSEALGLGVLACWLLFIREPQGSRIRRAAPIALLWLLGQGMLTFSRGGVYLAALGVLATLPQALKDRRLRKGLIISVTVVGPMIMFVLVPSLNAFTGGKLAERFQDTGQTHREDIAREQLGLFLSHPVLGVGPGRTRYEMGGAGAIRAAAHTEFTRLLAEHGMLGALALLVLLWAAAARYRAARRGDERALVGAAAAWSFGAMYGYAMRIAAPSFLIGVSFAAMDFAAETPHSQKSSG